MYIPLNNKQRGITLVEAIASLAIMSGLIVGAANISMDYMDSAETATAAQQLRTVGEAAKSYINDNAGTVSTRASATVPCVVLPGDLGAYVPGIGATNVYGQSMAVLVTKNAVGGLQSMAVAYGGAVPPEDGKLAMVANTIGAEGGGIYATAPTIVRGVGSAWNVNLSAAPGNAYLAAPLRCSTGAAMPALVLGTGTSAMSFWVADTSLGAQFIYRSQVAGRPDLNTMNTPLIMGSVQVLNVACATIGAISRDAAGAVLSCQGGTWKSASSGGLTWKGAVANFASLPASGNISGDAYRVTGLASHAFVWDATNSIWQGMVIDSSGNLTLPGLIYAAGSNSSYGAVTVRGSKNGWSGINFKDVGGANAGTLMMHPSYSGFFNAADGAWRWYVDNAGNSIQAGKAEAGMLQVNTAVAEGAGCAPDGLIAKSNATSGLILSCQSGVWKKATGSTGTGMSGILAPLAGKVISCSNSAQRAYAHVDAAGNPYAAITCMGGPPGWWAGYGAATLCSMTAYSANWGIGGSPHLTMNNYDGSVACSANWPST